jgi:hypothetical protein
MLADIKRFFDDPENIPSISQEAATYLKARLNFSYLVGTGELDVLRAKGWSEASLLGFVEGASAACEIVQQMELYAAAKFEDQQLEYGSIQEGD